MSERDGGRQREEDGGKQSRDKDTAREGGRETGSLLPFPGSQVFISLFADAGFITQSSTGAGRAAAASRSE